MVLVHPVLLKDQACLKALKVLKLDLALKVLQHLASLKAPYQHLHLKDPEVLYNLTAHLNHLHLRDLAVLAGHLVLAHPVHQAFPRVPSQHLDLKDLEPLKVQASLKDLTDPNNPFLLKVQVSVEALLKPQASEQAQVVSLRDLKALQDLRVPASIKDLEAQASLQQAQALVEQVQHSLVVLRDQQDQ